MVPPRTVQGAPDALKRAVHQVEVDHRGLDVLVAHEFSDHEWIDAVLEKACRK